MYSLWKLVFFGVMVEPLDGARDMSLNDGQ